MLDVTVNNRSSRYAEKLIEVSDTNRISPSWVTFIVRTLSAPLTVMVASRFVFCVLAVAVTSTSPSFDPEMGETVSQVVASLLTVTGQAYHAKHNHGYDSRFHFKIMSRHCEPAKQSNSFHNSYIVI